MVDKNITFRLDTCSEIDLIDAKILLEGYEKGFLFLTVIGV